MGAVLQVWVVGVAANRRAAERQLDVLDAEERSCAEAFVRHADRVRYRVAHVARRWVLGARLGVAPGSVVFGRAACRLCGRLHGRPVLAEDGPQFSLSHSGDLALLAVSGVEVGIDVERIGLDRAGLDDVLAAVHPDERACIAALPDAWRARAFAQCWVRKEAYLKALGTGLGISPTGVRTGVGPAFGDPGPSPGRLGGWTIVDLDVRPGYAAAVAVRSCGGVVPETFPARL
jgi:4'-phosphopantetheinyl transferase